MQFESTLLLSSSPPALRPPTPNQIQEANNKMKTIMQVQKQNKATYDNVLRNVIKIQSTMRRFLAQKELKSLRQTFVGDSWKSVQTESAILIQSAYFALF